MTPYYYDFHIHSCLSPCSDDDMTPNNIAGMAALKGLQIIALTDHNTCKNCPAFFEACKRQGVIPVAGMELSTAEDIHLVCLFENLENAMQFDEVVNRHLMDIKNNPDIFGNQFIMDEDDEVVDVESKLLISATNLWIDDAIELAKSHGAHVHPAHIDRESNGIIAILGDIPKEYGFNCLEFNKSENIAGIKSKFPALADTIHVVSSDAHHLWDINEADHFIMIDDEPYSSLLVRKKLFEYLNSCK